MNERLMELVDKKMKHPEEYEKWKSALGEVIKDIQEVTTL